MPRPASLLLYIFAATAVALPVWAQNGFQTRASGGGQTFSYSYATREGEPRTLQFRLNSDDIARGSAEFRAWDDIAARSSAISAVQAKARELERPNLKASIQPLPTGMNVRISGYGLEPDSPQVRQLNDALDSTYNSSLQTFARNNLYRATSTGKNSATIQPDHPAIAARYTNAMRPVAQAILQQVPGASENPRAFINAAMTWLQTIPYDTLQNRSTSKGAGFETPYGLIASNSGDCDTKATALAALIRAVYPTLPLAIIYVPEHAFLGIGLPQGREDFALRTEHGTFILADATGPGLTPLGYIDKRTQARTGGASTDLLLVP